MTANAHSEFPTVIDNHIHWVAVALLLCLSGCASVPAEPIIASMKPNEHLDVVEVPSSVSNDEIHRLFFGDKKNVATADLTKDRQLLETQIDKTLKQALKHARLPRLENARVAQSNDPKLGNVGKPLTPAQLTALQAKFPANAYLRIKLTDYGQTPKTWEGAYVTFEVVSTLAIAGFLYVHPVSRSLAGIYLVQESAEELGEGYAGFWIINRMSRPVRIEADLVDGKTGKVLWHDSETGMADWHWKDLWHMDPNRRGVLLTRSTDEAVDDLVEELEAK